MYHYHCEQCNKITRRKSSRIKIKSYCDSTGKDTFLVKINNADDIAEKMSTVFLKNQFDLKTFKPKEVELLNIAFEQGLICCYFFSATYFIFRHGKGTVVLNSFFCQ